MKITLKDPVSIGSDHTKGDGIINVSEFNMREKVVSGDLRGLKVSELADPPVEKALVLAGRLCGQLDLVMQKLSVRDTIEVVGAALGFFASGLTDGKTQSA